MKRRTPRPGPYSRPWKIEVFRSGELTIRHQSERPTDGGSLVVFSVDTKEEAESIQIGCCVLSRHDNETYRLNPSYRFNKAQLDVEDLPKLGLLFERYLAELRVRRAGQKEAVL